ncbi:MAG: GPR endopeptidase [Anaeroplasmataceae bacterium]|nr:GPR endopeptidase [Anaeroplasmataceae bacterium]
MKNRTDMAVEQMQADFRYDVDRIIHGMHFKKIKVDSALAKKIQKKEGIYYTIDHLDYRMKPKEIIKLLEATLYDYLVQLNLKEKSNVLIVGLGNDFVTPDALGPLVINKIEVNRHLENHPDYYSVSALCPSVMGKTGMESKDIVQAIVDDFHPDLVMVIDALACRDASRMCNSIQISTAGINPGSGIYNFRREISKETLGVDVLAIGIPTVSDIDSFVDMEDNYFVTPKDIDLAMDILSGIVAEGINRALRKQNNG